jgi:IS4 transposase
MTGGQVRDVNLLDELLIAQVDRTRWQVELFFAGSSKQHLRIKNLYSTSENAVKTQVWVALLVYLLTAIVKKQSVLEPRAC